MIALRLMIAKVFYRLARAVDKFGSFIAPPFSEAEQEKRLLTAV